MELVRPFGGESAHRQLCHIDMKYFLAEHVPKHSPDGLREIVDSVHSFSTQAPGAVLGAGFDIRLDALVEVDRTSARDR